MEEREGEGRSREARGGWVREEYVGMGGGDGEREGSMKCRERHTSHSEVHFHSPLWPTSAH